uniref:Uncharacterized protein n=1 Tax=Glossina pallidipes TaxID=7398 RepID=A0A1B0A9Q4_GLOPL
MILTTTILQQHDLIISIKFHNDYIRLLNTVAYMLRFIYNCKFKAKGKYGSLDATELDASRLKTIKYIQSISFHAEIAAVQKGANPNAKDSSHLVYSSLSLGFFCTWWRILNGFVFYNIHCVIHFPRVPYFSSIDLMVEPESIDKVQTMKTLLIWHSAQTLRQQFRYLLIVTVPNYKMDMCLIACVEQDIGFLLASLNDL